MGDSAKVGSFWTWCAIDSDTKLVPVFHIGQRGSKDAALFCAKVHSRIADRVQVTTDGFPGYVQAMAKSFGRDVDYGQVIKIYGTYAFGERKYSTSGVLSSEKIICHGAQGMLDLILQTSYAQLVKQLRLTIHAPPDPPDSGIQQEI